MKEMWEMRFKYVGYIKESCCFETSTKYENGIPSKWYEMCNRMYYTSMLKWKESDMIYDVLYINVILLIIFLYFIV